MAYFFVVNLYLSLRTSNTYTTSLRFVSPLPERSYADSTISWRATLSVLCYAKPLCGRHSDNIIQKNFVSKGMCADWALHDKGDGNSHAHIMLTVRTFDEKGKWVAKQKTSFVFDEEVIQILETQENMLTILEQQQMEIEQLEMMNLRLKESLEETLNKENQILRLQSKRLTEQNQILKLQIESLKNLQE